MNVQSKIGDNRPALITAEQLGQDFSHIKRDIEGALALARNAPDIVEDEDDLNVCREAVKGLMAQHKRAEATRIDTKNPYLDAERVVDSFFNTGKKMLADMQAGIEARTKRYLDKKEADERARREEEARIARAAELKRQEEAAAAARAAAEERRKADEAARAAERADANKRAAAEEQAAAARRAAEKSEADARAARQKEIDAAATTANAERATKEKPADMARTRVGDGMATLVQNWEFTVDDFTKIDFNTLRSFFTEADIEKAIRRYVAVHKGDKPLAGVRIFQTTKAQMR